MSGKEQACGSWPASPQCLRRRITKPLHVPPLRSRAYALKCWLRGARSYGGISNWITTRHVPDMAIETSSPQARFRGVRISSGQIGAGAGVECCFAAEAKVAEAISPRAGVVDLWAVIILDGELDGVVCLATGTLGVAGCLWQPVTLKLPAFVHQWLYFTN